MKEAPYNILRKIEIVGRLRNERLIPIPLAEKKQNELLDQYLEDATKKPAQMILYKGRRFKIALSFPGEKRDFIQKIALALCRSYGESRVFYDEHFKAELGGRIDGDTYLQSIYLDHSELIVVFLCEEYEKKEWCGLEWRVIRDLIKRRETSKIMLFKFDNAKISGLLSIDTPIEIGEYSPEEIAKLIGQRYELSRA